MKGQSRSVRWLTLVGVLVIVAGAGYFLATRSQLLAQVGATGASQPTSATSGSAVSTVEIEPVDLTQLAVSAAGNLALVNERSVVLGVDGVVTEIAVAVGDTVKAGDLLLKVDTTDLEQSVAEAELSVEAAKLTLAELQSPATAAELVQAQAALLEAQENLAAVKAGPSAEEIAAARASLAAAQASYSELTAGPSTDELTQLSANLKKAELTLQEAQRAYNQVSWQGDVGASSQAAELQSATIDYEAAKAAYNESIASASNSSLQSGLSSIQSAKVQLNELLNSPTAAEIASAAAQVAEAEATSADLQAGPTANEVRSAEITLQQALINLQGAYRDREAATVTAPIAGVILTLDAEAWVRSAADSVVATIGDLAQLELVINVAEADMVNIALQQPAAIAIDALPGQTFHGAVRSITPLNDSSSTSVNYPVTIQVTDEALPGVLPGMNAVATLLNQQAVTANSWLVPTNALRRDNGAATVMVVRGANTIPVAVTPGAIQGEWTMVQSPDLQEGDQVVGSLVSNLDSNTFPGAGGGFPGGGMGGPPPSGGGMGGPRP